MDVITETTIETASAEAPNARSWKIFADQINGLWRKGAGNFIECGRLLGEANDELRRDAFNAMVKSKLAFDSSVARKLMCIAANETLCAHGHKLPPCWTTIYELSKVEKNALEAAFADGTIHPGMMRKDATALKPSKKTTTTEAKPSASTDTAELLGAAWQAASADQRQRFLDQLGRAELCVALSAELKADLQDHILGVTVAGASKTSPFATYATGKLHTALRCAEQPDPDSECTQTMVAALGCIVKKAETKGITRSDIVVAEGKPKGRK